jgi:hypothetical protein
MKITVKEESEKCRISIFTMIVSVIVAVIILD